jgi:SAM-dependent methyltransferase
MAHQEQREYFLEIKNRFPVFFKNTKVLDIGSLDINGNNRHLFTDCDYSGLDIAEGKNVDIISLAHEYNGLDESFDLIISNDCFEHDMFYEKTLKNVVRMLKPKCMFLFTCKTKPDWCKCLTGCRCGEHGTLNSDGGFSSPLTAKYPDWSNYFKNLTENDFRESINVDEIFSEYNFSILNTTNDIRFWGIKK